MNIKVRINNIEFRNNCNTNPSFDRGEFLVWYPNSSYGKYDEYIKDGWVEKDGFVSKNRTNISVKFFDMKENCYVIAWLNYDKKEGCCDLESVGPRILELNEEEDRKDFFDVYKIADLKMIVVNKSKEDLIWNK
jgi:hypothetical protein